ncbi:MAG: GntR family transcriptional regulator [Herminiimonas sp.]|nr:GntR family transcriptional regulator [Herminiimonas sp.]
MIKFNSSDDSTFTGTSSLTEEFARRMRDSIIRGERPPGSRLYIVKLEEEFGMSLSPIREGLSRLAADGLISVRGQRGYYVSGVDPEEMRQVLELRLMLEPLALRQAIQNGGREWEAGVVVAAHRDEKIRRAGFNPDLVDEWERNNREFHEALIGGCGNPLLISFCGTLHDRSHRHRSLFMVRKTPQKERGGDHHDIVQAVLARNADRACELLYQHISRATEGILHHLSSDSTVTESQNTGMESDSSSPSAPSSPSSAPKRSLPM